MLGEPHLGELVCFVGCGDEPCETHVFASWFELGQIFDCDWPERLAVVLADSVAERHERAPESDQDFDWVWRLPESESTSLVRLVQMTEPNWDMPLTAEPERRKQSQMPRQPLNKRCNG